MVNQNNSLQQEPLPTRTILLVEDDYEIGKFLILTLQEDTPYQAILATDGFQALKLASSIKPNLFILDYFLPGTDGVELYDHLHTIPGHEDVPAIFISATLPVEELEKRHVSFLKKPFELEDFLDMIENLLAE